MGKWREWFGGSIEPYRPNDIERADDYWDATKGGIFPDLMPNPFYMLDAPGACSLPALWRALRIKSDLISTLPLRAEIDDRFVPVVPEILAQPDPTEDRQLTLAKMVGSLVLRGESVAVLDNFDDVLGFPSSLKVIDPRDATLNREGTWTIANKTYPRDEILHICPFLLPGETRGRGTLELHRRALAGEIAASDYHRSFYSDGGQPNVKVRVTGREYSLGDMDELSAYWSSQMSRARRRPIVLPDGIDAEAIGITNDDAQYIESRTFSLNEMALIVGVPAYFLGGSPSSMTYSNVTEERKALLDIHLRADLYCIERAFSTCLPDGVSAKFDPTSFLRADTKGTVETLVMQSWLTLDEKRAVMGLDPLTEDQREELGGEGKEPDVATMLQKLYLAVGKVITPEEAREIANRAGANLPLPGPEFAPAATGAA